MKKRNWLLSLVFAVLSLTIISTCVIGSTYAKFTSQVNGTQTAQSAGFLITAGGTEAVATNVLMAPGAENGYDITVNYFSQVQTIISTNAATEATVGTGIFAAGNWTKVIAFYNTEDNLKAIGKATLGAAWEDADWENYKVSETLAVTDVLKVTSTDGADLATAFVKAVQTASPTLVTTSSLAAKTILAMPAEAQEASTFTLNVSVEWVTQDVDNGTGGDNDVFDTFLGNCVAAFEQGVELSYPSGESTIKFITTEAATDTTIQKVAVGTKSEVGVSVNITATQDLTGTTYTA